MLPLYQGFRFRPKGIAGLLRKKLNQSLIKYYPEIPDIAGQ
jgi:hypothetical protein